MSVRVEGVPLVEEENPDTLFAEIQTKLKEVNIDINPSDVVRFHRSAAPKKHKVTGVTMAQCIIKVVRWGKRQEFHGANKKARASGKSVRVFHDLTKRRLDLLNKARTRLATHGLATNETFAYVDINCNLKIRQGRRSHDFNTDEQLDGLFGELFGER